MKLDEVLAGVRQAEQRQMPQLPPALSQVAYGEAVIDSRLATSGCLFVALSGDLSGLDRLYATYAAITPTDVRAAAESYLRTERRTVGVLRSRP